MAKASPGKDRERSKKPGLPVPPALQRVRGAGVAAAWLVAVAAGWRAGSSGPGSGAPWDTHSGGAPPDLLTAALRGAAVWLGITAIWLIGFHFCMRIIQSSGVQAFRRSGVQDGDAPDANP